jgi:hypothetical protein
MGETNLEELGFWISEIAEGLKQRDGGQYRMGRAFDRIDTSWGGQELQRVAESFDIPTDTVKDYRYVYRAFGENFPKVRYSLLRAVAARKDRYQCLEKAEKEQWTVKQLREAVKAIDEERKRIREANQRSREL